MRTGHLLFSAVYFFVNLALLCAGILFFYLERSVEIRAKLSDFIFQPHPEFFYLGSAIILLSLFLFIGFYSMTRHQYLRIKMQAGSIAIEPSVIRDFIQNYWDHHVSSQKIYIDVQLSSKQKIEVIAKCSELEFAQLKIPLEEVERQLGSLLAKKFHYHREFFITFLLKNS